MVITMSKGSRKREVNAEKHKLKREKEEFEAKKRKVRHVTAIITGSLILALILVTVVGTIIYNVRMNSGEYLRREVAASSYDYDVDGAMMNYYFNDVYNTFVDYYGSYVSYYGLDTTLDLKKQEISDGETWFEYFMSGAKNNVSTILALNEAADDAGVSLSDDEVNAVSIRSDNIDTGLYGRGVNRDDIYNAKLLEALAYKYQFMKEDEFTPSVSEIEERYNENPKDYQTVDYYSYSFAWSDTTRTEEEANALAEQLASVNNVDAFIVEMKKQMLADEPELTDEELESSVEYFLTSDAAYTADDELSEWLFGGAAVGETKIITDEENSNVTVYMLASEPSRDESKTANVRHILLTETGWGSSEKALEKAEELLAEFEAGDKSEESFGILALAYSEDEGSYYNGGLYENVLPGQMVESFDEWCFDDSRAAGDVDMIETDYGYHIMYYVGEGLESWQSSVSGAIISEKFNEYNTELEESYPVEFDDSVLNLIPG